MVDEDAWAWVTVGTYLFEHEAAVVAGRLESQGIGTRILDAGMVGVAPHLSNAIGGVRLQVKEGNLQHATAILSSAPAEPQMEDEDGALQGQEPPAETALGRRLAAKASSPRSLESASPPSSAPGSPSRRSSRCFVQGIRS